MGLKRLAEATALREVVPREYTRDLAGLVAQLSDGDPAVRRWAARDLAAYPQAAQALCDRLAQEPEGSVRAVLFSSAAQVGGMPVAQSMIQLLRSEDAVLRNGAIEVLAHLPAEVAPCIDRLLADPDSDVRIFTVNLLGELRHVQVPAWLNQVLLHDEEVNVVGAAIDVLAEVGGPASLPALRSALKRFADQPFIGFSAGLAIERIEAA